MQHLHLIASSTYSTHRGNPPRAKPNVCGDLPQTIQHRHLEAADWLEKYLAVLPPLTALPRPPRSPFSKEVVSRTPPFWCTARDQPSTEGQGGGTLTLMGLREGAVALGPEQDIHCKYSAHHRLAEAYGRLQDAEKVCAGRGPPNPPPPRPQ